MPRVPKLGAHVLPLHRSDLETRLVLGLPSFTIPRVYRYPGILPPTRQASPCPGASSISKEGLVRVTSKKLVVAEV